MMHYYEIHLDYHSLGEYKRELLYASSKEIIDEHKVREWVNKNVQHTPDTEVYIKLVGCSVTTFENQHDRYKVSF